MADEVSNQDRWLGVIARALSYLCVHATDLREAELTPKAVLLEAFGLPRRDVALLLNTTEDTIRVLVGNAARQRKQKRRGRKRK